MTSKDAARRKTWRWETYQPGITIEAAGVRILSEAIDLGPDQRHTFYDVRYTCCGEVSRLSHKSIEERRRKNNQLCRQCGRKRTAEVRKEMCAKSGLPASARHDLPDYGVILPPWPASSCAMIGRNTLDCDIGAQPGSGVDWTACFLTPGMAALLLDARGTTHRWRPDAQRNDP